MTGNRAALKKAEDLYHKALEYDSTFAQAYAGLAQVYWDKNYFSSEFLSRNFMDSAMILIDIALSYDNKLSEAYTLRGAYYDEVDKPVQAIKEFDKALKYNSNNYQAYNKKGTLFCRLGDYVQGIENKHEAVIRNRGADLTILLGQLARSYLDVGFREKAKYYYTEALKLGGDSVQYFNSLAFLEFCFEDFDEALKLAKRGYEIDTTRLISMEYYYYVPPSYNYEAYENAKKKIELWEKRGLSLYGYDYRIGYAFWRAGKRADAEYYFKRQIKTCEERIKLSRYLFSMDAYYELAASYAFLGEKGKAYKYLEEFDRGSTSCPLLWWTVFIKHDPFFDSFRNEQRFQKIQKSVEAKYQAEHDRVQKWLEEQGML
jgi:tetratricopeptide (TPR) repeat protein